MPLLHLENWHYQSINSQKDAIFLLLVEVWLDCATFLVYVWDPLKCSEKKLSTALCMDILWNEVVNSPSTAPSGRVRNG